MGERVNIVCVAGFPGAGKSSLCSALADSGDFHTEEVDDHKNRIIEALHTGSDDSRTLREILGHFIASTHLPGFETSRHLRGEVLNLLRMSESQLLHVLSTQPRVFESVISYCAQHSALQSAAKKAKQNKDQRIIFPGASLTTSLGRDVSLKYFQYQGIIPNILIVKARIDHLMQTEQDRKRGTKHSDNQINRTNFAINESSPVHPAEEWHGVHVLNNQRTMDPSELADSVRNRLLACHENTITRQIGFLI